MISVWNTDPAREKVKIVCNNRACGNIIGKAGATSKALAQATGVRWFHINGFVEPIDYRSDVCIHRTSGSEKEGLAPYRRAFMDQVRLSIAEATAGMRERVISLAIKNDIFIHF